MSLSRVTAPALFLLIMALPATAQDTPVAPCEEAERRTEFDFWLGEWDVFGPENAQAGTNRIEKLEQGCLILESWTGASGGTGTSVNLYDPGLERWRQLWMSSTGVVIDIQGGLRGAEMVLEGTLTSPAGQVQPFRGTWTPNPDGSVRQHFEISGDDGRTWATWFDGLYVRRR